MSETVLGIWITILVGVEVKSRTPGCISGWRFLSMENSSVNPDFSAQDLSGFPFNDVPEM